MLFCARSHMWLRLQKAASTGGLVAPRAAWTVQVGLTARGLEDVGSVLGFERLAEPGTAIAAGQALLRIDWDAHLISGADELYHVRTHPG